MSRVIKFRAWDKDKKEMYVPVIDTCGKSAVLWYGYEMQDVCDDVVMQYTGLKDKNGVEIYDGDVVKITKDTEQKVLNTPHKIGYMYGDCAVVEWNPVNMRWSIFNPTVDEETDMDYYGAWSEWNWLEVIGNIYENPELIKQI